MQLGKPPVIEAWIEFRFSVEEHARRWDQDVAAAFFREEFDEAYAIKDFVGRWEMTVEAGPAGPSIKAGRMVFERARASNPDGDRVVQAGRDVLIYNMLRAPNKKSLSGIASR